MHISARKFFFPAVLAVAWLLVMGVAGFAQTRTIKGKVTDDKDQPVADAQISIQGIEITRAFSTKTNKKGEYVYILDRTASGYRVIVRKEGFRPDYKDGIRPELGDSVTVDFKLSPGPDQKLPFELNEKDLEEYKKKLAEQEKRKQFSGEIQAAFKLGVKLTEEGKYDEALAEFNKALEKMPEAAAIHAAIGNTYSKAGKKEESLAAYQKAISLSPNDADLYSTMAILLNSMGKTAESIEAFKKAAQLNPAISAQSQYNIGKVLMNSGKADEAAEFFKQAIAADASFSEAYYELGMALSGKQNTIPAAIEALKKYIEIGKKPDQVAVAKEIVKALGAK